MFRDTRVAAGEDLTSDIMKCQLKPLARADYAVSFSDAAVGPPAGGVPVRRLRLLASRGVGQVAPKPWQTFMDGPGGRPLGDAPESRADGRATTIADHGRDRDWHGWWRQAITTTG